MMQSARAVDAQPASFPHGDILFVSRPSYIKDAMETDREFSSVVNIPQFPGPSIVSRRNAPADPEEATALTIQRMKSLAAADASSPQVMRATAQALVLAGESQQHCAAAIFDWIKRNCRFREDDPVLRSCLGLDNELELLIAPAQLLSMRPPAGDCDCLTTLCMSMLLCAGVPAEPLTIKADADDPTRDSHVYCQALCDDGSFVLDPAMGCKHGWNAGDEAPGWFQKNNWGVINPDFRFDVGGSANNDSDLDARGGQQRKGLHGLDGFGFGDGDFGGEVGPADTVSVPTSGPGINWNPIIAALTAGGLQIAKMQATPVGYVQQASGAYANYGAGGGAPGIGGISTTTLLIGGGLLVALIAFSGKR